MAGAMVKPGLFGELPSLSNLQDGDLRHHTDFRQVYAAVIQNWFQCEAEPILKGHYDAVDVFATMDKQ